VARGGRVGLFGKLFSRKDEFADKPPDFSSFGSAPTNPTPQSDPLGTSMYGKDPFQTSSPYDSPGVAQDGMSPTPFDHDIFNRSDQPSNADSARSYADSLKGPTMAGTGLQGPQSSYAGAITGHETQLILERLDTIKAELDAMKQRMIRVERFLDTAEQKQGQRRYF
jgi:hypothetical protein